MNIYLGTDLIVSEKYPNNTALFSFFSHFNVISSRNIFSR